MYLKKSIMLLSISIISFSSPIFSGRNPIQNNYGQCVQGIQPTTRNSNKSGSQSNLHDKKVVNHFLQVGSMNSNNKVDTHHHQSLKIKCDKKIIQV